MRRLIDFPCEGETLVGTLDAAAGSTGLLIVSGGNEIRCGAHRGMAMLAAQLASEGVPVFRFDRRGIGDSSGENGGYASAGPDIAAAVAAFRAATPGLRRLIGFGNCDAATALALHGNGAFDRLILANPWVTAENDDLPPAEAIKARYAERMGDPRSWARLATGGVNIGKLASGLLKLVRTNNEDNDLAMSVFAVLAGQPHRIIVAERDATAIAFLAVARRARYRGDIVRIDSASHSFARDSDKAALHAAIVAALG